MLLFQAQGGAQVSQKQKPVGFADVISEAAQKIADALGKGGARPESPPYFMKSANDGPAPKKIDYGLKEWRSMSFAEFRNAYPEAADKYQKETDIAAANLVGPMPKPAGNDSLKAATDTINYNKKSVKMYIDLMSDQDRLDKWRKEKGR